MRSMLPDSLSRPASSTCSAGATESLIEDGRGQSDLRQRVTLEVFGEGESMGPLNETLAEELVRQQTNIRYGLEWTTLGEPATSWVRFSVKAFAGVCHPSPSVR
jgi:hypothetical protein